MAITQCMTNQAKQDFLNGVHQPTDVYKIALYSSSATLDRSTTSYTATGEIVGSGYSAGGATLTGFTVGLDAPNNIAYIDFNDPSWPNSTLTNVSGAMIYNSSRSNKAIAIFSFTAVSTVSGTLSGALPPTTPSSGALIRIS